MNYTAPSSFDRFLAPTLAGLLLLGASAPGAAPPPNLMPASRCAPPPVDLAGWWRGEGDALDTTGSNHGAALSGVAFVPGLVDRGFRFADNSEGVRIPASASLNIGTNDGLTLEAWIRPDDLSIRSPLIEWNHGGAGLQTWGVHLYI